MSIDNKVLGEFEKEKWLYLDNSLSETKMNYWTLLIEKNKELNKEIELIDFTSKLYQEATDFDLDNLKFNEMIDKTITKKNIFQLIKEFIFTKSLEENKYLFGKVAFASFLIVFALIVSLTSNKSNPTKNIARTVQAEILDWDAKILNTKIDKIGTLLMMAKNDNYKKYYMNRIISNEWNKNTFELGNKIKNIKYDLEYNKF